MKAAYVALIVVPPGIMPIWRERIGGTGPFAGLALIVTAIAIGGVAGLGL